MRVALYARVSTRDKDQNPETQLYALRQYAERREWEISREYMDTASAVDMRARIDWGRLIEAARLGEFNTVLVLKLDRAFRSVRDTADMIDMFQRCRVGFISVTQEFDTTTTTTTTGRLMLNMLAAFSEFERDILRERTREGMARARAQGKHLGRRIVMGDVNTDLVAKLRAEGKSWVEIQAAHPRTVKTTQGGYKRPSIGTIRRAWVACQKGESDFHPNGKHSESLTDGMP